MKRLQLSQWVRTAILLACVAFWSTGCTRTSQSKQVEAAGKSSPGHNWANNVTYRADKYFVPVSVAELQGIVRDAPIVKAVGSRHSFSRIADTTGTMVSTEKLNTISELNIGGKTVTVLSGIKYGDLAYTLNADGWAIHNLASLPHISVGGAISTGTHGSGDHNGNLSTEVTALEFVNAKGELVEVSRAKNPDVFPGMVVGLGGFGVITKVTLTILPKFFVRQFVFQNLAADELYSNFEHIMGAAYSVSLFTDYSQNRFSEVWLKELAPDEDYVAIPKSPKTFYGAAAATRELHPVESLSPANTTGQMGFKGAWFEKLPHFKYNFKPSVGEELQSEYFVPRARAIEALKSIFALREVLKPVLIISEIRSVAADDLWMSPAFGRDSVTLHFTWKEDQAAVMKVLPEIEKALRPYGARPHWGKLQTMTAAQLRDVYPKMREFRELMARYDPQGKFRNEFLNNYIFKD